MDPIADIKSRISIEDLVAQYVPLKKSGRYFKALCPFHKERSPSFIVSPEREMAYCFGCRKGGDQFKFIQEMEGLDFRGALEFLAEKAGVTLPKKMKISESKKTERDRLLDIHDAAAEFYEEKLWETDEGKKVLDYLQRRGLKDEIIKSAKLGFAPDSRHDLFTHLLEKNYTREEILLSGLAMSRDIEKSECVDRFRMRLMFPIQNLSGRMCAFGGRAIREGDEPKYLNSSETPVYHKSSLLYGLASARAEIRRSGCAVLVEGYMDALACRQAGFTNAVACSGTALTEGQLAALKRFTKDIIFALDRDTAGRLATNRAIEIGFDFDLNIKIAVWESDAKDPDECLRKEQEKFCASIEQALPVIDYLLRAFREEFGDDSMQAKKKTADALVPFLAKMKSPIELDLCIKQCAKFLGASERALYDEVKRFLGRQKPIFQKPQDELPDAKKIDMREYLVGLLLTYPETYGIANQIIVKEDFEDNQLQNIYRSMETQYNLSLNEEEQNRANLLRMYTETRLADCPWEQVKQEVLDIVRSIMRQRYEGQKRILLTQLRNAIGKEKSDVLERYQELLAQEEKFVSTFI